MKPSHIITLFFLILFLSGCSSTTVKYQCFDGSFVDSVSSCLSVSCKNDCPHLDCASCPVKTETKVETKTVTNTIYVCSDLREVDKKEDCLTANSEEWYEVKTFSGSGIKNTETFTIPSNEWKISWDTTERVIEGQSFQMNFQIFVYKSNGELAGLVANVVGDDADSSIMRGKGNYYLQINSGQPYDIKIEAKK
ncbi:hypothetical protein COV12_02225 [Candidatus Woesearchaeota archaeon CG10_big_fil_rev_8_21_14_0_10_32_24]|nr:MAG: hypothetical protein COV12_02225 [Candidatus Woesearchaeota archaeon CG10_big_fil_rev_8_21_14_0_10_32_24]